MCPFHSKGFPLSKNSGSFQNSQKCHHQENNTTTAQFWCITPPSWVQRWPPLKCWFFPKLNSESGCTHLQQHALGKEDGTLWNDYMQHNTRQDIKYLCLKKRRNALFYVISKNGLDGAHQESSSIVLFLICERHTDTELLFQGSRVGEMGCNQQAIGVSKYIWLWRSHIN